MIEDFYNLCDFTEEQRLFMEKHKIPFNKLYSKILEQSRNDSKQNKCVFCKKEITGYCKSHSIPQTFLKNISVNGKVYSGNQIIEMPLGKKEKGLRNSGTFHIICNNCDNTVFQEYESHENYSEPIKGTILAQIALKNYLHSVSKRRFEIAYYKVSTTYLNNGNIISLNQGDVNNLDLLDYMRGFRRAKKIIEKECFDEYQLIYSKRLDYVAPIAFQGALTMHIDIDGNFINNVFNMSPNYHIQNIHICVFPLHESSIILLFTDKKHTRYRQFAKQFKKLSDENKLKAINFIIFSLSEDMYLSKTIDNSIYDDKDLKSITGLTSVKDITEKNEHEIDIRKAFDFSKMHSIPNFLNMKHKIET